MLKVDLNTGSQMSSHKLRDFFMPSWAGVVLYLLLSAIILLALNAGSIISWLSYSYIGSPEKLKTNFTTFSNGFSDSFSSALGGRLGQIMLWAFVGALAYLALWLARNVFNSFENDVISDSYIHPSTYSHASYWTSSLSVKLFLASTVIITVGYFFIAIRAVLPAIAALAGSAVYNFEPSTSVAYIISAVAGTAMVLYFGFILLKLVHRLWKII
jgi:hypothetical protein